MPCKVLPFIPTERKVAYIQSLLRVGFDSDRFWEFCVAKSDSANGGHCCIGHVDLSQTTSKLLLAIANTRGAEMALSMLKFNI
jgi:hydroxymethylglutaryl-CoA lyase